MQHQKQAESGDKNTAVLLNKEIVYSTTVIEKAGEQIKLDDESIDPTYLSQHNADLAWV